MNRDLDLLISFLQPIKELLLDDSISEIMGNPDGRWWYEQKGRLYPAEIEFEAKRLRTGLEVIANKLSRKLDEAHPLLNAQLPDGSRLAAVLPPVVRPFPALTIRKFARHRFTLAHLIANGSMPPAVGDLLRGYIEAGKTILISGGTGSGKTTLLNVLADFIPEQERIVVIEDTSELRIDKPNLLASECQNDSQTTPISYEDLLKAALRWRPDRIILGEVRGEEARTLLDSFNTGHAGSLTTIHASSAAKALRRFSELAMRSHQQSNRDDIATEIADSVQIVVQVSRFAAGRKVSEIIAVNGYDRAAKLYLFDTIFDSKRSQLPLPLSPSAPLISTKEHAHAIA